MQNRPLLTAFVSSIVILILDQGTKWYAATYSHIVLNTGISFGFFPTQFLTLLLCGLLGVLVWKFGRTFSQLHPIATGFFFGASLSNVLDRFLFGGVRDFLPVPLLTVRNNLADWAILLSLFWLFFAGRYNTDGKKSPPSV